MPLLPSIWLCWLQRIPIHGQNPSVDLNIDTLAYRRRHRIQDVSWAQKSDTLEDRVAHIGWYAPDVETLQVVADNMAELL